MKLFKASVILIAVSGLTGCASAPQGATVDSRAFTVQVKGQSLTRSVSKNCPKTLKDRQSYTKWMELVEIANNCVAAGRWDQVARIGGYLTQGASANPWGAYYRSLAAEGQGELHRARWFIDLAVRKAPQSGLIYFQKARILWALGEPEAAAQDLQRSVDLDPALIEAQLWLGQLHLRDQEYVEAEHCFKRVLARQAGQTVARLGLMDAYLGQGKTSEAELIKSGAQADRKLSMVEAVEPGREKK